MMRIDLPMPLRKGRNSLSTLNGGSTSIIVWILVVVLAMNILQKMTITPTRLPNFFQEWPCTTCRGWQNKQSLGSGEFTLPFGDYKVSITVPADHVVASTGKLVNESKILNAKQRARLSKARGYDDPVIIVTQGS